MSRGTPRREGLCADYLPTSGAGNGIRTHDFNLGATDTLPVEIPDEAFATIQPSVCHYKASKELGYVARPIIETLRDTYAWFDEYTNCQAEG